MSNDDRFQPANFNRPPRIQFSPLRDEHIEIPTPPSQPPFTDQGLLITLLPVLGIGVMAIFYVLRAFGGSGDSFFFAIPMFFLAIFTIGGTVMAQRWRRKEHYRRQREAEINYLRALDRIRARLQAAHDAQSGLLELNFPTPQEALSRALARDLQLWERRPNDSDFGAFRLGIGRIPSKVTISTPTVTAESPLLETAFALADQYRYLNDVPIVASLTNSSSVGFCGQRAAVLQSVRAAICHLAVTHAPQDLHIHLIAPDANYDDWRWLEWLPHSSQSQRGGAADLVAFDHENTRNLLGILAQVIDERREQKQGTKTPHLLLVIDAPQTVETEAVITTILRDGTQIGASAICIVSSFENIPGDCETVVEIGNEGGFRYARTGAQGFEIEGQQSDGLSLQDTEHIARALSSVVMRESGGAGRIPRHVDFLDLYGVRRVDELPRLIHARWRRPVPKGVLPHPILIGSESLTVKTELLLDEDHHGPHGVLAGTTGSGKSELLQTMICSMVLEHDPRLLTLLLIDFKGGSTFNVFAGLPHVVGTVTNLDGTLVERTLEALRAEVQWRQQFLKSANIRDITQYHRYYTRPETRLNDPGYHPLPHLFIIVDEFAQLAREMPEFLRELVRIAQVGRSLGLHLILGTQSPMDVITDEMNANLQFRICLRVQNIEASRAMLRRPDAAYLPSGWPGRGYFQVGERGVFKQFQTAYVGGDYQQQSGGLSDDEPMVLELITDSGQTINLLEDSNATYLAPPQIDESSTTAKAICDLVIRYAREENIAWMKPILLPPMPETMSLAEPMNRCGFGGWNGRDWNAPGRDQDGIPVKTGSAPVGLIDDVYNRTQHPLWIHLNTGDSERTARKDGHVLVVGSPGSGKTTFLRTLALSEALLHPPDKLHMYFLSFTGTGLDDLSDLPHAERVIYGTETERVRRLFGRLIQTLNERQSGQAEPSAPIIMLCIDQFEQFRDSYRETHMPDFERLIHEGRAVGIYLIFTASSIGAIPDRIRSLVQQRIALQAGDPSDYMMIVGRLERHMNGLLPAGRGYLYHSPPLLCQISLPSVDPAVDNEQQALASMRQTIRDLSAGYEAKTGKSQSPAPIQELPTQIPLHTLLSPSQNSTPSRLITPLGRWDDDALSTYALDWDNEGPHFIVTGPPGSGKTNFLQAVALSAAWHFPPSQLRFLLVDFNGRSLRALGSLKHVIRRVTDPLDLKTEFDHLERELSMLDESLHQRPLQPDDIPATVVIIDDYDAVSEELRMNDEILVQLRDCLRLYDHLKLYVWVAGYMERTVDPLIRHMLLKRAGFGLSVKESLQKLNVRSVGLPADAMPEGRAYLPKNNRIAVVQTAWVDDAQQYVDQINTRWSNDAPAAWHSPVAGEKRHTTPLPRMSRPPEYTLDIDTAGLIEDLLGGRIDEDEGNGRAAD